MDTFIGLGIVVKNNDNLEKELEGFFDFLEIHVSEIDVSFPHEGNYSDWQTKKVFGDFTELVDDLAFKGSQAEFSLKIGDYTYKTVLTLSNEQEDLVIHLALEDSFTIKRSIEQLELLTQSLSTFISNLDNHMTYDYIFCDNEAEYLYKKERMIELGYNPYAILKLFDRHVVYASWYVDGQTTREKQ